MNLRFAGFAFLSLLSVYCFSGCEVVSSGGNEKAENKKEAVYYNAKGVISHCEKSEGVCGIPPVEEESLFAQKCEAAGYAALYCGCGETRYICSGNIKDLDIPTPALQNETPQSPSDESEAIPQSN